MPRQQPSDRPSYLPDGILTYFAQYAAKFLKKDIRTKPR
jgi:hypothetical protein